MVDAPDGVEGMVMRMLRNTKVTLMLAQAAQAANGLLNVLGAGWTVIGPGTPFAIAGIIEMPWEAAGVQHRFMFELLDDQGKPVVGQTPEGDEEPVRIGGGFDLAPNPGIKKGTPLSMPIAINLPPPQLEAGARYEWRLEIDGETHEDWRLGFGTQPESQSKAA
jgi:hypothetical protein